MSSTGPIVDQYWFVFLPADSPSLSAGSGLGFLPSKSSLPSLVRARSLIYIEEGGLCRVLDGCENLSHRGACFGIFKKVRIFATELAGILIS